MKEFKDLLAINMQLDSEMISKKEREKQGISLTGIMLYITLLTEMRFERS